MTRQAAPYPVRFVDENLRERLTAIAQANRRSLNAEINFRLLLSLQKENAPAMAVAEAFEQQ